MRVTLNMIVTWYISHHLQVLKHDWMVLLLELTLNDPRWAGITLTLQLMKELDQVSKTLLWKTLKTADSVQSTTYHVCCLQYWLFKFGIMKPYSWVFGQCSQSVLYLICPVPVMYATYWFQDWVLWLLNTCCHPTMLSSSPVHKWRKLLLGTAPTLDKWWW
jgi:hypothetical protein